MSNPTSESPHTIRFHDHDGYYRGSAKVLLASLEFDGPDVQIRRTPNEKQVEALLAVFKLEGCHRLEPENRVPAIIRSTSIGPLLTASSISLEDFMRYTATPVGILISGDTKFRCLRGRHRIEAAKRFLRSNDKWWTVDFYSDGKMILNAKNAVDSTLDLPEEYQNSIRSYHSHSQQFCDGDIYRNIRFYEARTDTGRVDIWMNRLGNKQTDIKTLNQRSNDELRKAFDDLVPFVGLWADFRAGMLKRVLTMKCTEELVHYLTHIRRVWGTILDGLAPYQLDSGSVQTLQLLAPACSSYDRSIIITLFDEVKVFRAASNQDRETILGRLLLVDGRVPSLFTFLEDTKYLEPCAKAMRILTPLGSRKSIKATMHNCVGTSVGHIEYAEQTYNDTQTSDDLPFSTAYRQVWLYTLRYFPELTGTKPRLVGRKLNHKQYGRRDDVWTDLALLATRMGFTSGMIDQLQHTEPRLQLVLDFLQDTFPRHDFIVPNPNQIAREVVNALRPVRIRAQAKPLPVLSQDVMLLEKAHLCGKPYNKSLECDRDHLFLPYLYGIRELVPKRYISSFAIQRDIFFCFFGYPEYGDFDTFSRTLPLHDLEVPQSSTTSAAKETGHPIDNVSRPVSELIQDVPTVRSTLVSSPRFESQDDSENNGGQSQVSDEMSLAQDFKIPSGGDYGPYKIPAADIHRILSPLVNNQHLPLILYCCEEKSFFMLPEMESTARKTGLLSVTTPLDNRCYYYLLDANEVKPQTVQEVHLLVKGVVLIGKKRKVQIVDQANREEICALQSLFGPFDFGCLATISTPVD